MTTLEDKSLWETTGEEEVLGADILKANTEEIINRTRLLDNDIKVRARTSHCLHAAQNSCSFVNN
jgi:hypothetical protein